MKDLPGLARANSLKLLCLLQLLFNTICLLLFVLVLELISRAKPWGCIRMDLALLVPFFTRFLTDRPTDRRTDQRPTDRSTDRPTTRTNDQTNEQTSEGTDERTSG